MRERAPDSAVTTIATSAASNSADRRSPSRAIEERAPLLAFPVRPTPGAPTPCGVAPDRELAAAASPPDGRGDSGKPNPTLRSTRSPFERGQPPSRTGPHGHRSRHSPRPISTGRRATVGEPLHHVRPRRRGTAKHVDRDPREHAEGRPLSTRHRRRRSNDQGPGRVLCPARCRIGRRREQEGPTPRTPRPAHGRTAPQLLRKTAATKDSEAPTSSRLCLGVANHRLVMMRPHTTASRAATRDPPWRLCAKHSADTKPLADRPARRRHVEYARRFCSTPGRWRWPLIDCTHRRNVPPPTRDQPLEHEPD